MITIPVSAVMTQAAPLVSPGASTVEAATHLRRPDVPALLVGDAPGSVTGIVTESDVVAVVAERGGTGPVGTFMSSPLVSASPSTPLDVAADRMREEGVATLPVMDDGTYRGLVTRDALAPYLSRRRLAISWDGEPLSLDGRATRDAVATE